MEWKKLLTDERLCKQRSIGEKGCIGKYTITAFESDYQTIINASSFRRLQDKTQVFPLDKSDFVRTRLTHSLEVSAIARCIGKMVLDKMRDLESENKNKQWVIDYKNNKEWLDNISEILACAGLLHDIGNPPFGHFGEVIMSEWFKDNLDLIMYKGVSVRSILSDKQYNDLTHLDGNAQALRNICKLPIIETDYGMNLTMSLLNALVKYPVSCEKMDGEHDDIKYHKQGFYDCDSELFDIIATHTGTKVSEGEYCRHPLTYLLEAADDIAYTLADVEDGYKKGLFTLEKFIEVYEEKQENYPKVLGDRSKEYLDKIINYKNMGFGLTKEIEDKKMVAFKNCLNEMKIWFMNGAVYSFFKHYDEIMQGTSTNELMEEKSLYNRKTFLILKDISKELIFEDELINKIELSGSVIIKFLLDKFVQAILYDGTEENVNGKDKNKPIYKKSKEDEKIIKLLSENFKENYKFERKYYCIDDKHEERDLLYLKMHLVVDYISGMTDTFAQRLYKEFHGEF